MTWIRVEDRLPEPGMVSPGVHRAMDVNVVCCGSSRVGYYSKPVGFFGYQKFSDPDGAEVTHWQPLPEAPSPEIYSGKVWVAENEATALSNVYYWEFTQPDAVQVYRQGEPLDEEPKPQYAEC